MTKSKIAMHEILPDLLWIGHAFDVREPQPLFEIGIKAVIDLAYEERPAVLPRQLVYCRFPLNDGEGNEPETLRIALTTILNLLASQTRTLVACSAGMSRSPTLAAFAAAAHLGQTPENEIRKIAESQALEIKPAFWNQVASVFDNQKLN